MTVVTGPSGVGQVEPRVRHAVRGRPAALRRDVLGLCAAVPRPHGPAAGRPRGRRAARDRDRPDQPGAQLALDGRHDDRAQRPPEAAVRRAQPNCSTASHGAAGAPRHAETIYADLSRARRRRAIRASRSRSRSNCPNTPAKEVDAMAVRQRLSRACRRERTWTPTARAQAARRRGRPLPRRNVEKVRVVEAIELSLKRGGAV
jgi:hypothetical protein